MKKILIIGYVWPEPNSSAAGSRMIQLINAFLSWHWQVEFATPAQFTDHMANLSQMGVHCQPIKLNCPSFDNYVQTLQPDIVLFDRFMMEEQFGWRVKQHCPNACRVLDTEDLFFLRNARHKAVKQGLSYSQADLYTELTLRELAAIYRCDLTLMVSDYECELLMNAFALPANLLHHLPFMLTLPTQEQVLPDFQTRSHFISIGNFRHPPNWDAVLQLKQHIWPQIRQQLPNAEMHIYGAYTPPKAQALHNRKEGFLIKGWADDAMAVLQQARVCLAPLRFGAGIKGKLSEAMQCDTPSVTTPVGAEGMATGLGWSGLIAQDNDDFAQAAVSLYSDEQLWLQSVNNGRKILKQNYDIESLQPALKRRLEFVLADLSKIRQKNIVGAMLNHHQHRSTAFMAQWIAAKNKESNV